MFGKLFAEMAEELSDEVTNTLNEMRPKQDTRTLTIAKPYCMPARGIVTKALQPYGVKIYSYHEEVQKLELRGFLRRMGVEIRKWENLKFGPGAIMWLPQAWVAQVEVSEKQAAWAEYLMLRTGRLYVPGRYVNKRNADWAARHGGHMPPAWKDKKPWIEGGCKDGAAAWQPIKEATKEDGK